MELTPQEGRVLGCLVEKELTTPQAYPLTDNALVAACNQTTSRDPVVSYDVATVRLAVRSLREQGLLRTVHRTGERSDKHRHELPSALGLSPQQVTVLAVLLLRGPQTAAEVRARSERMLPLSSEEVESALVSLASREEPLTLRLDRQPGRKEARWAQLLAAGGLGADAAAAPTASAEPAAAVALRVLEALERAVRGRDLEAALSCFADDAVLVAAEVGQRAEGREQLRSFFDDLFARPVAPDWDRERLSAAREGEITWFLAEGLAAARGGQEHRRPCRLSGVLLRRSGRDVLAQLHGSRPVPPSAPS